MVGTNEALVETFGLTKVFRDFWHREKVAAVRKLDLEINPGEVFGLLGPNGSGKSTALKMILGLLYPTSGYVRVFGRAPTDVATKARIGFLPEESYLYPFLDARETLDYYGRLFKQPRAERRRRIDMLLDMVGLASVGYRRVGEYSKGMQRRIGLAQALINDPDLLILDEPTSGMDPLGTRQFKDLIRELGRRGKTVILSSHLLADVEDVCDRVAVLYGGRKRAVGDVGELLSQTELTQITAERLAPATVARIKQVVAEDGGKQVLDVSAPHDKLESLFLRIVEQAQAERVSTGGAVATGNVAEFLRAEPEGEAVVERLLEAGQSEGAAVAADDADAPPAPAAPLPAASAVIDELVRDEPAEVAADPDEPAGVPADAMPVPEVDRGVIDSLLDSPEPPEKSDG